MFTTIFRTQINTHLKRERVSVTKFKEVYVSLKTVTLIVRLVKITLVPFLSSSLVKNLFFLRWISGGIHYYYTMSLSTEGDHISSFNLISDNDPFSYEFSSIKYKIHMKM